MERLPKNMQRYNMYSTKERAEKEAAKRTKRTGCQYYAVPGEFNILNRDMTRSEYSGYTVTMVK